MGGGITGLRMESNSKELKPLNFHLLELPLRFTQDVVGPFRGSGEGRQVTKSLPPPENGDESLRELI